MKRNLIFFLIFFIQIWQVSAQELPGKPDSIYSAHLNEQRKFLVVLPDKYEAGEKYEVLYILDGDWNSRIVSDIKHFVEESGFMPPVMMVSILNTDRNHDFTPTRRSDLPASGGAAEFLAFLKDELIPYINGHFPVNGTNVFFGHSLAGLFGLYAMLQEPQLFRPYILADPAFSFDLGFIDSLTRERLSLAGAGKSLFISGREGRAFRNMGTGAIINTITQCKPADLHFRTVAFTEETHGSMRMKSLFDGLKYTYAGYGESTIDINPMSGIVIPGVPFQLIAYDHFPGLLSYTIDHREPQPLQEINPFSFSTNTMLNIFADYPRNDIQQSLSGQFIIGQVLSPVSRPAGLVSGGLHFNYYLNKSVTGKADSSGTAGADFDVNRFRSGTGYICKLEGYFEAQRNGYYIFEFFGAKGSSISLGGKLLIGPESTGNGKFQSFMVPLEKGLYFLQIEYVHPEGGGKMHIAYMEPGTENDGDLPANFLYYKK